MVVNPSFPAKTVPEFIAYAKAHPARSMWPRPASATHPHGRRAVQDDGRNRHAARSVSRRDRGTGRLLSGRVQVMLDPIPSSLGYIRGGKLRGLAVTSDKPMDVLPNLPTMTQFCRTIKYRHHWHQCAEGHACRRDRHPQQGRQHDIGRSQDQGAVCRLAAAECADASRSGKVVANETAKWAKVVKFALHQAGMTGSPVIILLYGLSSEADHEHFPPKAWRVIPRAAVVLRCGDSAR